MSLIHEINSRGFGILRAALDALEVESYLKAVLDLHATENSDMELRKQHLDYQYYRGYGHHIFNLCRKSRHFDSLIEHPAIISVLQQLFDGMFILTQTEARSTTVDQREDGSANVFHRDARFICDQNLWIVVFCVLEEITDENGPTILIPETHKNKNLNELSNQPYKFTAKAGDVLFMNGNLLHKATKNINGKSRWLIINTYNHWSLKPTIDHTNIFRKSDLASKSETFINLLGYTSKPPSDERSRIYTCTSWDLVRSEYAD